MARNRRKVVIRIKPDWNVNRRGVFIGTSNEDIRIKPDWNVNEFINRGHYGA